MAGLQSKLAGLSETEQRKMLMAMLMEDATAEALDGEEDDMEGMEDLSEGDLLEGEMPELDADGRTATCAGLNFEARAWSDAFQLVGGVKERLIDDCKVVFPLDGSHWLGCKDSPRCSLESMAREVFDFHTTGIEEGGYDPAKSGAEWWVQVRSGGNEEEGIEFHWDMDEFLIESTGLNVHPHLSTVTYLSECGAPTLVCDTRTPTLYDDVDDESYGHVTAATLCVPATGKHLVFDGRFLHGAVPIEALTAGSANENPRVTFMVNIWLNYVPIGAESFPDELLRRMQKGAVGMGLGDKPKQEAPVQLEVDQGVADAYRLKAPFGRERKAHCLQLALPRTCLSATAPAPKTWRLSFASDAEGKLGKHVEKKDRKAMLAGLKAASKAKKAKTTQA